MKLSNTVVSVIIIAAVLVGAYALGLLIRQARLGRLASAPSATGDPSFAGAQAAHGPGMPRTKDTPEERAKIKDERAKILETTGSLTEEQKARFRTQVHERVGGRRAGTEVSAPQPPPGPMRRTTVPGPSEAGGPREDVNTPASPSVNEIGPG
ncbi:MAG: hypothetical protein FJ280_14755 [Planctomycetes bacterium]|nr:hypothetical protein [Planctomycetota bacterium]